MVSEESFWWGGVGRADLAEVEKPVLVVNSGGPGAVFTACLNWGFNWCADSGLMPFDWAVS